MAAVEQRQCKMYSPGDSSQLASPLTNGPISPREPEMANLDSVFAASLELKKPTPVHQWSLRKTVASRCCCAHEEPGSPGPKPKLLSWDYWYTSFCGDPCRSVNDEVQVFPSVSSTGFAPSSSGSQAIEYARQAPSLFDDEPPDLEENDSDDDSTGNSNMEEECG